MTHDERTQIAALLAIMARVEAKVDVLKDEHSETRRMVIQHRTGWQVIAWLGATTIAVIGAIKGLPWDR